MFNGQWCCPIILNVQRSCHSRDERYASSQMKQILISEDETMPMKNSTQTENIKLWVCVEFCNGRKLVIISCCLLFIDCICNKRVEVFHSHAQRFARWLFMECEIYLQRWLSKNWHCSSSEVRVRYWTLYCFAHVLPAKTWNEMNSRRTRALSIVNETFVL